MNQNSNPINTGSPLDPNTWSKNYQEGVDYKVEVREGGFKKYYILSEKLKADIRRFNNGHDFSCIEEQTWKIPPGISNEELERKIREETEAKRQKFIADNDLPQLKGGVFYELGKQEKLFNSQQGPLTEAEKAVLNDPILKYQGDWEEAIEWIIVLREVNSDIFPDEKFKWGQFLHKDVKDPEFSKYKVNQAFKNAGISLDKWKERVAKGQQIEAEWLAQKPQKDKEKILANIQDWEIRGEYIYNPKTGHWKSDKNNMWTGGDDRYPYYHIYDEVKLTPETYQEVRKAIFNNFLKSIHYDNEKQCLIKKETRREYTKEHFLPSEWKEITRLFSEKGVNVNVTSSQLKQPTSADYSKYYVIGGITVGLVLIGAILLKNWRKRAKRKHDC